MNALVVRPARELDAAAVEALSRRPFAAAWSMEAYAAETARPDALFLVADDGRARGYALARLSGERAELLDFAVEADGRGIGRALWTALTAGALRRGARVLSFEVSERNARARAFYARAGARVVGRRSKFYNDGSDALLMDVALA